MEKVITIGRANSNDIVLGYPQISRHHAEISLVDRERLLFRLRDLETLNGTYKNGEKIVDVVFDSQKDKIMVGHINIRPSLYLPYFFDHSPEIPSETLHTDVSTINLGEARSSTLQTLLKREFDLVVTETSTKNVDPEKPQPAAASASPIRIQWNELLKRGNYPIYFSTFVFGAGVATMINTLSQNPTSIIFMLVGYMALAALLTSIAHISLESMRRVAYQKVQQSINLELLEEKVSAARVQRVENDRSQFAWSGNRKFVVVHKIKECENVYSFYLAPHDKKSLPAFKPGQYLTIALKINDSEKPIIRCYSLSCSSVESEEFRISVKKLPHGACSGFLHQSIDEGDILDVRAPSGHFYLDITAGNPIVLIAGGIGVTPILSMLNTLADIGSRREVWIFYGVTNGKSIIQQAHLIDLAATHPNFHLHICFSRPFKSDLADNIHLHTRINIDLLKSTLDSNNYEFYLCGPAQMMRDITAGLEAWAVPPEHIHYEGFGPASVKRMPEAHEHADNTEFWVRFAKSDKNCPWKPRSGSLLNLARANQINIESGCEAGNCGTCLVAIREGEVRYLSEPGTMPEKGSCLTCIAVPKGELVIDA